MAISFLIIGKKADFRSFSSSRLLSTSDQLATNGAKCSGGVISAAAVGLRQCLLPPDELLLNGQTRVFDKQQLVFVQVFYLPFTSGRSADDIGIVQHYLLKNQ
uniref:Uncharacterized protein n=1 Tax=Globodera rostochiensis TaxID=31243 RepID=A0A914HT08_GLORO